MTNEETNRRFHEILDLCWHISSTQQPKLLVGKWLYPCYKCNQKFFKNIDFFTWTGFGILWGFMEKHERWDEFVLYLHNQTPGDCIVKFISPPALVQAVVGFFEGGNLDE